MVHGQGTHLRHRITRWQNKYLNSKYLSSCLLFPPTTLSARATLLLTEQSLHEDPVFRGHYSEGSHPRNTYIQAEQEWRWTFHSPKAHPVPTRSPGAKSSTSGLHLFASSSGILGEGVERFCLLITVSHSLHSEG